MDLAEAGLHPDRIAPIWQTEAALAAYTKRTQKIVSSRSPMAGGLLKALLRRILYPQTTICDEISMGTTSGVVPVKGEYPSPTKGYLFQMRRRGIRRRYPHLHPYLPPLLLMSPLAGGQRGRRRARKRRPAGQGQRRRPEVRKRRRLELEPSPLPRKHNHANEHGKIIVEPLVGFVSYRI